MNNGSFSYDELTIIYRSLQDSMSVITNSDEFSTQDKDYLVEQLRNVAHKVMTKMEEIEDAGSC
jgi:hypothetical protein